MEKEARGKEMAKSKAEKMRRAARRFAAEEKAIKLKFAVSKQVKQQRARQEKANEFLRSAGRKRAIAARFAAFERALAE